MSTTETEQADQALLDGLVFKKRHTTDCQTTNSLKPWQQLTDKRKRCACPYWSCGVHGRGEKFDRKSTGENTLERARDTVKLRLETSKPTASLPTGNGKPIGDAVADFMSFTREGGAVESTLKKYKALMDQLQAFSDWKGFRFVHELGQDAVMEFRRSWEEADAGYKQGRTSKDGRPLWTKQSIGTCRRNAKTLRYFFKRGISRKWQGVTEDPTSILQFPKQATTRTKESVKYLTPEQFDAVMAGCNDFTRMTDYNKQRIAALILTMRWTGLRISDAVVLTADKIKGDVLRVRTKKASTDVQIPLHPELVDALAKLEPYSGGYLFWNKRTDGASPATPQGNFCKQIAEIFQDAGIASDAHHVSHMLRNTFAVHLLEKGVPLETVSLMLGHKSVKTTELYYADFTKKYMDEAEAKLRKVWGRIS
ncbi:MAG: tyrosine-type recombinase/integrase [Candidatus Solibacter sp.]|jgi:site-specific recombinase XerD